MSRHNSGHGRGGDSPGDGGGRCGGGGGGPPVAASTTFPAAHVQVVGVRRSGYGCSDRPISVSSNFFNVTPPKKDIHHYDAISFKMSLPARLRMDLINHLMCVQAVDVFTPPAVYDGGKNIFAPRELPFGSDGTRNFNVSLPGDVNRGNTGRNTGGYGQRVYKVRLTKVATINPEVLKRFIMGQQSYDSTVTTALTALNVVIRMEPKTRYPFSARSFFTDREVRDIGSGIVLWRGYFQSIRPAIGRLLVKIDTSTCAMYKGGPLIDLCLDFLGRPGQPQFLSPQGGMSEGERMGLQRFIAGLRVIPKCTAQRMPKICIVKELSSAGASSLSFTLRDGVTTTVAQYFYDILGRPLTYPDNICVRVGAGALIPVEICAVPEGQIMRKQVPPEKTKDVLDFAMKKPHERLACITDGLAVFAYEQSPYVRGFGMHVDGTAGPINLPARILPPPKLRYGQGGPQTVVTPSNGSWNMIDKRFFRPATIDRWIVVIYECQKHFNQQAAQDMITRFVQRCRDFGMRVNDTNPMVTWQHSQGRIVDQLRHASSECYRKTQQRPSLVVVVLPNNPSDIYTAVKHFGDVTAGVATQCMQSSKCYREKTHYYTNVCLKVNVKLGGINTILDPQSVSILTDPRNPTIVMGAHVTHPALAPKGCPSFAALVGNVDSGAVQYIATCRVQTARMEIIEDLGEMAQHILDMYMNYRRNSENTSNIAPTRLIYFRSGVSEGQFEVVLEYEACRRLNVNPKITMIVVNKHHHVRLSTTDPEDADRSGNCPAGTVVDQVIAHPAKFDWYLISHDGLLGASRPAHYNDPSIVSSFCSPRNFHRADDLQSISFALYADIVCNRARNHYDPQGMINLSVTTSHTATTGAEIAPETYRHNFKPLHSNMATLMYFS
ncbi:argonaute-like protein [Pisolithus thermaeus]|nr:argonaute-like protein [Pisolithus thermaeus]